MKCANCANEAAYEYRVTTDTSVFYCGKDLPKFLEERKKAGLLSITLEFTEDLKDALDILGPSSPETVEAPKPKKKTAKKSAK